MNWLHACWGIGATAGPLVMSAVLLQTASWRAGFQTIAYIQFALAAVLLVSLPLWRKHQKGMDFHETVPGRSHGRQRRICRTRLKKIYREESDEAIVAVQKNSAVKGGTLGGDSK